tara:strand:+ start:6269 stop:6583 length:315 start_codon:yes stop_codon:yes gene_type:complete
MAEKEAKQRIGSVQTVLGKFGPFKKISLNLSNMGKVFKKDGKHYLKLDEVEGFNPWTNADGETIYFLNLLMNSYETISTDNFKPSTESSNSTRKQETVNDDLPF